MWDIEGTLRTGDCNFVHGKGNENHELGTGVFLQHRILLALNKVEFVKHRLSYTVLRVHWCNVIVCKFACTKFGGN